MIEQIAAAHFGLIDLSGMNPNVLVELGIVQGQSKSFLLFRADDDPAELPFDLAGYQVHRYYFNADALKLRDPAGTGATFEGVINAFIDEMLANDETFKEAHPFPLSEED